MVIHGIQNGLADIFYSSSGGVIPFLITRFLKKKILELKQQLYTAQMREQSITTKLRHFVLILVIITFETPGETVDNNKL